MYSFVLHSSCHHSEVLSDVCDSELTDNRSARQRARVRLTADALFVGTGERRWICRDVDCASSTFGQNEVWQISLFAAAQTSLRYRQVESLQPAN